MIEVRKFPDLVCAGRRLIWDSRQMPDGRPERVFIPDYFPAERVQALRARKNAEFIEGVEARRALGEQSAEALGHPSVRLCVLAVTGTNGKTSCAQMMARLCSASGFAVAEIGTLGVSVRRAGELEPSFHLETGFTTPDAPMLQDLFLQFLQAGITHVVMEASSHSMDMGRVAGTDFDGALFTNLTQDHLDYHGTLANYEAAKTRLFTEYLPRANSSKKKIAVINAGDSAGKRILSSLPLRVQASAFIAGQTFRLAENTFARQRIEFLDSGEILESHLIGMYNAENLVGSYFLVGEVLAATSGFFGGDVVWNAALADYRGPVGRMERVPNAKDERHVFVDYAHTPDALEKALKVLAHMKDEKSRLWVVFGCGGDRDRTKRPLMGLTAAKIADEVVLTSDNPRTEGPDAILDEIASGIPEALKSKVFREPNRRLALEFALRKMKVGDVCLVAGKGHEEYQIIGTQKSTFSDMAECRRIFNV